MADNRIKFDAEHVKMNAEHDRLMAIYKLLQKKWSVMIPNQKEFFAQILAKCLKSRMETVRKTATHSQQETTEPTNSRSNDYLALEAAYWFVISHVKVPLFISFIRSF